MNSITQKINSLNLHYKRHVDINNQKNQETICVLFQPFLILQYDLFNRTGVVGAVLQTLLLVVNCVFLFLKNLGNTKRSDLRFEVFLFVNSIVLIWQFWGVKVLGHVKNN